MAKKKTDATPLDDAPITVSTKEKKPAKKPKTGKPVTKMKILPHDAETEPLDSFQTGEALAEHKEAEPVSKQSPASPTITQGGNSIKINNVKVVKDLFLKVNYDQSTNDGMVSNDLKSEAPIHDDLREAIAELNMHCATLGNQYNVNGQLDTASISCVGFTLRTGNVYGVKLIAQRKLADGKTINILPPFTKLAEGSSYEYADELEIIIDKVVKEAILYLGGKHKANPQQSMDFGIPVEHTTTVFPAEAYDPANEPYAEAEL